MSTTAEDELQNVEMAEEERTKKFNEQKVKKRGYTGYDDEEFEPGAQRIKRAVLSKYDEDIEGVRDPVRLDFIYFKTHLIGSQEFRLGSSVSSSKAVSAGKVEDAVVSVNKSLLSIDYSSESLQIVHTTLTHFL